MDSFTYYVNNSQMVISPTLRYPIYLKGEEKNEDEGL